MPVKSIEQLEDHLHFLFFNYSLQVQYSVLYTYLGIVCLKESTAGVNRKDLRHTEKDAQKKAHTTQKKTQKKTRSSQRAAAASKLVPILATRRASKVILITGPGGWPRTVGHDHALKFKSTRGKMMLAPHSERRVETRRVE